MITLHNKDCFDVFKTIPDNSIKCIATDPPYAISFSGKTSNTEWDNLDDDKYKDLLKKLFTEAKRVLTDDGTLWLCCARTKVPVVFDAIKESGLNCNLENWMTYVRAKGRGANTKLKSQCEEVLHITKSNKYQFSSIEYLRECVVPYIKDGKPRGWFIDQNDGLRKRWSGIGNAMLFTSPFFKNKFESQIHSTQKPFLLFVELIMLSTKPGDTVMDPFAGSGSCGVAADCCGRNWIGCELDTDMYNKANNWLNNYDKELAKEYFISRVKYKSNTEQDELLKFIE